MNINIVELELTSLCNAKCSACTRTKLDLYNRPYYKGNITFDEIHKWFDNIDLTQTKFKLCGVLGDPMINPDLYDIIFYLLNKKNVREIEMSTNGGTRPTKFWEELGLLSSNSNKRFYIHWAIDGATRNDYRENVDLNKVWKNVDAYQSKGGHSIWQYIIFDYNEHEIDLARQMAKEKGMIFATRKSWRNSADFAKIKSIAAKEIDNDLYQDVEKRALNRDYDQSRIVCRHKIKGEIYIGANRKLWPCCHLYDEDVARKRNDIEKLFIANGNGFNDLTNKSILDILDSEWYSKTLEESWDKYHSMHIPRCYLTCGDNGKRAVVKNVEN